MMKITNDDLSMGTTTYFFRSEEDIQVETARRLKNVSNHFVATKFHYNFTY